MLGDLSARCANILNESRLRVVSLVLENPRWRTQDLRGARRVRDSPLECLALLVYCVLPRGFSSRRETSPSLKWKLPIWAFTVVLSIFFKIEFAAPTLSLHFRVRLGVKCLPGLFRVTFSFSCCREDPNYQQFPDRVVPTKLAIKFDVLREEPVSSDISKVANTDIYCHFQKHRRDNLKETRPETAPKDS